MLKGVKIWILNGQKGIRLLNYINFVSLSYVERIIVDAPYIN